MVSFTHGQNIICSQTQLDDIAHEQIIICRQLFAAHVVGFRPTKRKTNLHGIITRFTTLTLLLLEIAKVKSQEKEIKISLKMHLTRLKEFHQFFHPHNPI